MYRKKVKLMCGNQELEGYVNHEEMKTFLEDLDEDGSYKRVCEGYEYDDKHEVDCSVHSDDWVNMFIYFHKKSKHHPNEYSNEDFETLYHSFILGKYFNLCPFKETDLKQCDDRSTGLLVTNKIYKGLRRLTRRTGYHKLTCENNYPWEFKRENNELYGRCLENPDTNEKLQRFTEGVWRRVVKNLDKDVDYENEYIVDIKNGNTVKTLRGLGFTNKEITKVTYYGSEQVTRNDKHIQELTLEQIQDPIFLKEWVGDMEWCNPQFKYERKTGRNSKCPCGSGKKYKKCCLN